MTPKDLNLSRQNNNQAVNYKLVKATAETESIMENLMQFYIYDFSEFVDRDVTGNGLFQPYPDLEEYWQRPNDRLPYFIKKDDTYLGFVLVKYDSSNDKHTFSIAEFFVMRKYRRIGVGKSIAGQIFALHKGPWSISQRETNKLAQTFWRNVISRFTEGQFTERIENDRTIQEFDS